MTVNTIKKGEKSMYSFTRKAGRHIVKYPPIFSPDKKSLLVLVENLVRVYNIQTADCVRTLETIKTCDELVAIEFPEDKDVYACSKNGSIHTWTWESGAIIREVDLEIPEAATVYSFNLINDDEALVSYASYADNLFKLSLFNVRTGKATMKYQGNVMKKTKFLNVSLGWCDGDRYAAMCNGTKTLFIQNLVQPHLKLVLFNSNDLRIISVAAHPTDSAVAITDSLGRVTFIHGYLYDSRNARNLARDVMHWHYLPVLACCFSKEGSYLYTGGMEKVLIKWSLGNLASRAQEKQFIPRLPGYVRHIVANETHAVLSLSNNSIVIATAQMKVVKTIEDCGGLSPVARALGTSLNYHKPTDSLVLGGRTGHLQLYSTASDKLLSNIDITETNSLPPTRLNLMPLELEVVCAAVSGDGSWLVTSEYRNDRVVYPEERLKFWMTTSGGKTPFILNTCVNLSHGGCKVVSIALSNKGDMCVTAGTDQKFRIWTLETNTEGKKTKYSWSCLTACYYSSGFAQSTAQEIMNGFKNSDYTKAEKTEHCAYLKQYVGKSDVVITALNIHKHVRSAEDVADKDSDMGGVAISQDGSLIAAWFGSKLTVWDTHQCTLKTSLAHPLLRPKGLHVHFGNNDAAHYLVCTTQECLAVWSLLSLTIKWYVNLRPSCLAADPFTNKMAVMTRDNQVIVFTPHSETPLLQRKDLTPPREGAFTHCAFVPAANDQIRLYCMKNDCEIYALEPESSSQGELEVISRRNLPTSNFSALLAEQQLSEVKAEAPASLDYTDTDGLGDNAVSQFISSAPYMMPQIKLLSTPFLEFVIGRKEIETKEEEIHEEKMETEDMSSDEEEEIKTSDDNDQKNTGMWATNFEAIKEGRLKKIAKAETLNDEITMFLSHTKT